MAMSEAKIADDHSAIGIEQHIRRLDIAMDDVAVVQFGDGLGDVDQYCQCFMLIKRPGRFDEL